MTVIRLYADDQKLEITGSPKVACGDVNSVQIQVSFSGNWSKYEKSAVFFSSCDPTVYEVLMADNHCIVPHEVLRKSGCFHIGLRGVNPETQAVKTSALVKYKIDKGAPPGDATSKEPTPDVYQQILKKIYDIQTGVIDEEKIHDIVDEYLAENPPSASDVSPEDIKNAVNEYLKENPPTGFETDKTLILKNGVLSVNTTNEMEHDNTLPITSAGVYATVGNIEALLRTI